MPAAVTPLSKQLTHGYLKQHSIIFNIHPGINRADGMRHFPLSDEGFKTELSSCIAFHTTSVFYCFSPVPGDVS